MELIKRLINSAAAAAALAAVLALAGCAGGNDATISMSFARASFYDAPFPSEASKEGARAFAEKRAPVWTGK